MSAAQDSSFPDDLSSKDMGNRLIEYSELLRELYAGSQRYQALVESSDDAILSKDLNGTITSWNKGAQRIFGYTASEAIGRSIKMLVPPELHGEEDNILARLRMGLRVDHYVTKRLHKDGHVVDISLTISPIKDEQGKIIGASKVARDISLQLRESELRNHLSAIVESSNDAIVSKDLTGTITSWNKGAERIFGYSAEEVIGRSIYLLIPPEYHEQEKEILAKLRNGQRIEHFETVRLTKSGEKLAISLAISPIRNDRDEIVGASKVARDITAQKRVQDRIRESEEKFTLIFKSSPVGMVLVEPDGFRVIEANPAFASLMGAHEDELKNGPIWDAHHIHDPERWEALKEELATTDRISDQELRIVNGNGSHIDLLINATTVNFGKNRSMLFHVEDITERKAAFIALKESDRRKDEFIATLSHELRNPLAPLSNALQLLEISPGNVQVVEQAHEVMRRQLSHMVRLLDDLMDVSRVSRGVIELRKAPVEIHAVIRQSVETVQPMIDLERHHLEQHLHDGQLWVNGDATRLVQIFSNLLNNAAKYMESGGRIVLTTTRSNGRVRIEVADEGVGMDPAQLARIFDMFSQLEPMISRKYSGLGIGLNIVKKLVEMHGGSITAHSEGIGKGSRFVVELPLIGSPAA